MTTRKLTAWLFLGAVVAPTATWAQTVTGEGTQQITWSTVSIVYHGEKTPDLFGGPYDLTPLGAQQLYSAGSLVRQTYIEPPINGTQLATAAVVNGVSASSIDNSQIYISGRDESFITASALAFMQGLYPPERYFAEGAQLQNGSWMSAPLGGYQYPNVNSLSSLDFNFIWSAGNQECNRWNQAQTLQRVSRYAQSRYWETLEFYQSLNQTMFGAIDVNQLNFGIAMELYEYALYQYTHNTTFNEASLLSITDLPYLFELASQQQWQFLTNQGNSTIQSIAGSAMASFVLRQFMQSIASSGRSQKMSFLFSDHAPFLSFFDLSGLSTGPSGSRFNSLPLHGSVMTFELFSYAPASTIYNSSTPYPLYNDLNIRFLFRNGTSDTDVLVSYPLFHRGNSQTDMSWADFAKGMGAFALNDVMEWCESCQTATLFCAAIATDFSTGTSGTSTSHSSMPLAVAGVIGAAVTIAVLLLIGATLLLLGYRLGFVQRQSKSGDMSVLAAGAGGFKGREKLASDTDLTLKNGAGIRHERVGSWELNDGGKVDSSLDKEIEAGMATRSGDVKNGLSFERRSEDLDVRPARPFEAV